MFEGFALSEIDVGEARLRVRTGGSGPPLLLLHGWPQTHLMWGKVAADLARDFTVVAPDLRGYGGSTGPATAPDHEPYSKRAMGRDVLALMRGLGFERFDLAGHDRGGRVGYRLALDHPQAVRRLAVLDIVPTFEVYSRADMAMGLGYWHWFFLAQPHPFPEKVIEANPDWFFFRGGPGPYAPKALADYLEAARRPSVIHAMCEDYRAGATYDFAADRANREAGRRIDVPTLVLWGARGALARWYDVMAIWRDWAGDVRGRAIDAGHFIPEEAPAETLAALREFFRQ
ncbi:MAG: alpha/beta hydrolase [Phenylobacterium sp.]|uniref:alpha/beta fold hydrolase n=1 Tax=Phenylobacterium sp. TaxID=1871053 RepID=UPI00355CF151